jgi:hypothetical protein
MAGSKLSLTHNGLCPSSTTSLNGRSISVSYIGIKPYLDMRAKPVTGSDIIILNLLARQFNFTFELKGERTFDWVKGKNGSNSGLIHSVRELAMKCKEHTI